MTTPALTFGGSSFGNTGTMFGNQPAVGSTGAFGQPPQSATAAHPLAVTAAALGITATPFAQPQPAQSAGIFDSSTGGLFGQSPQPATQTSLFEQQSAEFFAASANFFAQFPFGSATTFGAPAQPATTTQTSLFGGSPAPSSGIFGPQPPAPFFVGAAAVPPGTPYIFTPVIGKDVVVKYGSQHMLWTQNYCVSMMKEHDERKSMEELRLEDYRVNRKSGTASLSALKASLRAQHPATDLFTGSHGNFAFGSTGNMPFGAAGPIGTTVKFTPVIGTDVVVKDGAHWNTQTKDFCISLMKEYDGKKSMEELRLEDYQANRKSGTACLSALKGFAPAPGGSSFTYGTATTSILGQPATRVGESSKETCAFKCPVCLDTDKDIKEKGVSLLIPPCGHLLCKPCAQTVPPECPVCRQKYNKNDLRPLFL